jgi:hypothetical protein
MIDSSELDRLLSLVEFRAVGNYVEGLDAFRNLLDKDSDRTVLRFLTRALRSLEGQRRGGIAFILAEHFRQIGDLANLQKLFATDDPCVKESVLNALWGEPGSNPQMGPGIIQMAIDATNHSAPEVRTEGCSVFQNQCAWGVDVSHALAPLQSLLKDQNDRVRHQAAYAVGNLAKRKYDMAEHIPLLRRNVKHKDMYVREASAWALWQLSRSKHDIGSAVPELVWLLTDTEEYNEQRKKAAGALIHHAKKSADNGKQVKQSIQGVRLDSKRKEIKRFLDQLARCISPGN